MRWFRPLQPVPLLERFEPRGAVGRGRASRSLRSRLPDSNRRPEDLYGGRRWSGSLAYSPPLYH